MKIHPSSDGINRQPFTDMATLRAASAKSIKRVRGLRRSLSDQYHGLLSMA